MFAELPIDPEFISIPAKTGGLAGFVEVEKVRSQPFSFFHPALGEEAAYPVVIFQSRLQRLPLKYNGLPCALTTVGAGASGPRRDQAAQCLDRDLARGDLRFRQCRRRAPRGRRWRARRCETASGGHWWRLKRGRRRVDFLTTGDGAGCRSLCNHIGHKVGLGGQRGPVASFVFESPDAEFCAIMPMHSCGRSADRPSGRAARGWPHRGPSPRTS